MLINLNANSQELTVFKLFQGVFDVGVEPRNCFWHCKVYSLCYMLIYFLSNRSMFLQTWVWECKDPDKLWLVWPFSFQILGCGVKISVMQQYLTAWTQASLFLYRKPKSESVTNISANLASATHEHATQPTDSHL